MVKAVTKLRQIIGFAAVINEKWNKTAAIEWIVLDPGFRGCGVGTQLLFHLHEYSIKHGARKIYVDTGSTSAGAINFYLANGYSAEAVLKDYYADGHDALWLSRRFKDSKIQKT
jgi:ribosomal protein S18 acetylase RimI-like enzyme